jgi:hypothetical protein
MGGGRALLKVGVPEEGAPVPTVLVGVLVPVV